MAAENGAMMHVPTLGERFWRLLGFRFHHIDPPKEAEAMPGWSMTKIGFRLDVPDRLRLLLTGRLHLQIEQHMNAPVETVISTTSWRIGHPYERGN